MRKWIKSIKFQPKIDVIGWIWIEMASNLLRNELKNQTNPATFNQIKKWSNRYINAHWNNYQIHSINNSKNRQINQIQLPIYSNQFSQIGFSFKPIQSKFQLKFIHSNWIWIQSITEIQLLNYNSLKFDFN